MPPEPFTPEIQEGIDIVQAGEFTQLDTFLIDHPEALADRAFLRAVGQRLMAISHLKDAAEHLDEIKYLEKLAFAPPADSSTQQ